MIICTRTLEGSAEQEVDFLRNSELLRKGFLATFMIWRRVVLRQLRRNSKPLTLIHQTTPTVEKGYVIHRQILCS
jgi:hypothetical protein